jgi:hypothetical protein
MKFARFRGWDDDGPLSHLPAEYVAAKFYFSASFPDSPETRTAVKSLLEGLASRHHVVLLNTGLRIDDHAEYEGLPGDRIHTIDDLCVPSRNLELQCRVISRARSFVGTYGGFSYIAPLYGVPALALYSGTDSFLQAHLDIARRAFGGSSFGSFTAVDLRDLESLRQVLPLAPPATQAPSPLVEPSRRSRV